MPRDAIRPLDTRLRAVETAIAEAESERWRRTNPEARARAEDTAAKLEAQIVALEQRAAKAEARGDHRAAQEAAQSAATYREWLDPGPAGGQRLLRLTGAYPTRRRPA